MWYNQHFKICEKLLKYKSYNLILSSLLREFDQEFKSEDFFFFGGGDGGGEEGGRQRGSDPKNKQ